MNKSKNCIIGKVKYEVLEQLFQMGDLTHPDVLNKTVTDIRYSFNTRQEEVFMGEYNPILSFLGVKKYGLEDYPVYEDNGSFIKAIRNRDVKNVSTLLDDNSIVKLWNMIQDIRVILNLKCVAKRSQSNNVMADSLTLLTVDRVLDNKQEYLNL